MERALKYEERGARACTRPRKRKEYSFIAKEESESYSSKNSSARPWSRLQQRKERAKMKNYTINAHIRVGGENETYRGESRIKPQCNRKKITV